MDFEIRTLRIKCRPCKILSNVEERLSEYFNSMKNLWPFQEILSPSTNLE